MNASLGSLGVATLSRGSELARGQAERRVFNATELEDEEAQEDGAGDDIEDTIPDHLRSRGDDIAALRQCPADRVGEEHECEVG